MKLAAKIFVIAALAFSCRFMGAADWPEFRGPTGQGHAESQGLPLEWSATQNVAWKRAIPGEGWSSPVIQDDRLFLTTAVDAGSSDGLSLRALCLNARTGAILWTKEVFRQSSSAPRIHQKNSHASPTPIIEGNRLYVHFGHQGTACLDLDGKVLWRNTVTYEPVHGNGGSPVLADDKLIFNCDGGRNPFVVALNKDNGEIVWKARRNTGADNPFSFSTPLLIEVNGQKQVVTPGSGGVSALDPETGNEIWTVRYDGFSVIPRPVYGNGLIFVSTGFMRPVVLAIRPDGQGDITETHVAWRHPRSAPNTPSMLVAGDELYMISDAGIATCLDARTGKVHWNERVAGDCSASPLYANGRVYFQDEQGKGVVVRASREFQRLAENRLNERTLASHAVADNALFIRGEKHLFRIEAN